MTKPFFFDRGTKQTFLNTIRILLEDIKELEVDRKNYYIRFIESEDIEDLNIFYSRAKHIEQMVILGVVAEFLIKAVLLKHGYVINKFDIKILKFDSEFITKLERNNKLGLNVNVNQVREVENLAEKGLKFPLKKDTVTFEPCIPIFYNKIVDATYFSETPEYRVVNDETKVFYGGVINYETAFKTLRNIRNNYAHVPESRFEENGILPFLYNFLVFVAKKEFPDELGDLEDF